MAPMGMSRSEAAVGSTASARFSHIYIYDCDPYEAICFAPKTRNPNAASLFGSLNTANTDLQVTDYANDSVDIYAYPSIKYKYSYSRGLRPSASVLGIVQYP
jgi:hypothetical protein